MNSKTIIGLLCAVFLLAPNISMAFFPFYIPFGGKIISPPVTCDEGVLFVVKGFPYTWPVMWIPGTTKPHLVNMGTPPVFGQCVLGNLTPTFIPCTVGGFPVGGGFTIAPLTGYGSSAPGCFF